MSTVKKTYKTKLLFCFKVFVENIVKKTTLDKQLFKVFVYLKVHNFSKN